MSEGVTIEHESSCAECGGVACGHAACVCGPFYMTATLI